MPQHAGAVNAALRQGQIHALDEVSAEAQVPTNPRRTRRIDYGLSHRRLWATDVFNFETCFSDHKVVGYQLDVTLRSEIFRPPKFAVIPTCAPSEVQTKFEQIWSPEAFSSLLERQDVDGAWAMLSDTAERALSADSGEIRRSDLWNPRQQAAKSQVVSGVGHESLTVRALRRLVNQLSQLRAQPFDRALQRRIGRGLWRIRTMFPGPPLHQPGFS